ncbi:MAG: nicotinate-nicotinamide nucleotide adenylyltransferase [Rhodospirillales bacterium]
MDFFRRAAVTPQKLGVLAGTFNPPTRAHLALARAALAAVDEVLFVLPHVLPHKEWEGASFADRVRMLEIAIDEEPRFSIAASERGLFIEIARECRAEYGPGVELYFLCGRDAADRIVNWDYGRPDAFLEQLREYQLLVAPRKGAYEPPPEMRERIHTLAVPAECDEISATEVRRRIRSGEAWEHLVPEEIAGLVREIYGR